MPMRKVPVVWTTGIGGAGVSVFYSPFGTDATVEIAAFYNSIKANFPTVVTWEIPASGDVVDEVSGYITGAWTGGTAASVGGSSAAAYVGGTGAYTRWQTNGIENNRRVKGRTFLVPLIQSAFDTAGTIAVATQATLQAASTTLAASGKLLIWHRPPVHTHTGGASHAIVGGLVPDKVTSLRTRRT